MLNKVLVVVKGVIEYKGRVLILQRSSKDEVGADRWETVGGKINFGEQLEEALVREVLEEAGIVVSVEKLLYATTFFTDPHRQIVLLSYLCRAADDSVSLSEEHRDYKWVEGFELDSYLPESIMNDLNRHNVQSLLKESPSV